MDLIPTLVLVDRDRRGGALTGGTNDVNRYQLLLVNRIAAHARSDGSTHISLKLEAFKARAPLELNDPAGMPGGS